MELVISKNMLEIPFHKHWQFCVGSGHAPLALRADYLKQLKQVHEELGIISRNWKRYRRTDSREMP